MIEGKLSNITVLGDYTPNLQKLEIVMDDFSTYIMFGKLNEYIDMIGKEVEFTVRDDIVDGIVCEVICNIAMKSIVQSVKECNVDLDGDIDSMSIIPDKSNTLNVITFDKTTIKSGDVAQAQIILVSDYKKGKSKITSWVDFTCLDCNSLAFNLRLFSNSEDIDKFCKNVVGKYAMVDIKNEPKYGLQVFNDMSIYEHEIIVPPEVSLSYFRLSNIVSRDPELEEYVHKYDLLSNLKDIIYYEPGYHLVEMVAEITLINAICKIFAGYNKKLLIRAVFASRGYLLGSTVNISNPLVNYHRIITTPLKNDYELIRLLDFTNGIEEGDLDKQAYLSIRRQVTSIMKGRRGINESNKINSTINAIDNEYSGMFRRGLIEDN